MKTARPPRVRAQGPVYECKGSLPVKKEPPRSKASPRGERFVAFHLTRPVRERKYDCAL